MAVPRALRIAALGIVVLASLVAVVAIAAIRGHRHVTMDPRVAKALGEIEQRTYPRAVHRGSVLPGRFGDAVDKQRPALQKLLDVSREHADCFVAREAPADPKCVAPLAETLAPTQALLVASRSAAGGVGAEHGVFAPILSTQTVDMPAWAQKAAGFGEAPRQAARDESLGVLAVCKRAAVESMAASIAGDAQRAVDFCLDALAWGRDSALGHSMMGQGAASACLVSIAAPVCRKALGAASSETRKGAREALERLRKTFPATGEVARDDQTSVWLRNCGSLLDDESRASLSPTARRIAGEIAPPIESLGVFERASFVRGCRTLQQQIVSLWDAPPADLVRVTGTEQYERQWAQNVEATLEDLVRATN